MAMLMRYGISLAVAQVLTTAEILVITASLQFQSASMQPSTGRLVAISVLIVLSVVLVAGGGMASLAPSLGWFLAGREPTPAQRRWAMDLASRQSLIVAAAWFVSGAAFIVLNLDTGAATLIIAVLAIFFGATSTICLGLIVSRRSLRPVIAAAGKGFDADVDGDDGQTTPGVLARLLLMWTLCSALPTLAIVALIFFRSNGWFIDKALSIDTPVMVLSLVAVALGLRAMILVSRSISDPVRSVVDAMAEVEHGRIDVSVEVYERSEIGRLQSGFNRMVEQLRERDRLRELFGRHVGTDVARRALEEDGEFSGDVRRVAVLFIDLVDSTRLAGTRPPQEVADLLNDFFRIVVATVDRNNGFVNKFQGDAALVVFGAPLSDDDAATSACASARDLADQLRALHAVDFGIGVSAGPVFAGNIGAENRYEYTVIGDPVNEAARLADQAKAVDSRVLCSEAVLTEASPVEQEAWRAHGSVQLRGRSEITRTSCPAQFRRHL